MQHCLQTFRDRNPIQQDILPNADFSDVLTEVLTGMGLDQKIKKTEGPNFKGGGSKYLKFSSKHHLIEKVHSVFVYKSTWTEVQEALLDFSTGTDIWKP